MKKCVFWGATGQAKVLWELLSYEGHQVIAIFDNNPDINELSPMKNVPIYHGQAGFLEWKRSVTGRGRAEEIHGLVAIGGGRGKDRMEIQVFFREHGIHLFTAIHPRAFVARDAVLGMGCQILANSAVASEASLGEACIVNTAASVDHDCLLGNGVHIGPGARLAGQVRIGDYSFVGTGAIVLPRINIGKNVIVGAGAIVTKDIEDNLTVVGNPARPLIKART
jgi:sugar O-acyltransferase (sialic acid O-acetyltransferase NeuD family)